MSAPIPWLGAHTIAEGHQGMFEIGPLNLRLGHRPMEWQVHYTHGDDPFSQRGALAIGPLPQDEVPAAGTTRVVFGAGVDTVVLAPALADRSILVRPDHVVQLQAGDTIEMYVGTPLWLRVEDPTGREVLDLPTFRPSDTWYGPLTHEGQLCYSSRTSARVRLEDVPVRATRVVTHLRVTNQGLDRFMLRRIALPMPNMSLHCDAEGRWWTPSAHIVRRPDDSGVALDEVRIQDRPEGIETERVSAPRQPLHGNVVRRVWAAVFGREAA